MGDDRSTERTSTAGVEEDADAEAKSGAFFAGVGGFFVGVDADTIVHKNLDALFDRTEAFAAAAN